MDAPSTEQKQDTKSSSWMRWFLAAVSIFLIYIFASGPAARLRDERILPAKLVDAIYDPLDSFCFADESTSKTYCWYLKLWGHDVLLLSGRPIEYDPVR